MKLLIAGGGTGGHLFPAVALAEQWQARFPGEEILFVGTNNPMEMTALAKRGYNHVGIPVEGLKGRGLWRQIRSLVRIPKAFFQALGIIRRFDPFVVVGVGGYASGPVILAAKFLGKKVVIHEQNMIPGLTNQMLARFADRICISFPDTMRLFKSSKVVVTGNPVRSNILATKEKHGKADGFKVLVVGGSQGAHAINCRVVEALGHLKNPEKMSFVHQTGEKDVGWVRRAYQDRGLAAAVEAFIEEMPDAYRWADVVICRAGATTVAELTAMGKPAIFIPFPFAADNHQERNARYVEKSGGGEVLLERDLDGKTLASKLEAYAADPEALKAMSLRAGALGRPEAAWLVIEECRKIVG
jgi:UDP-N-acetylglucosamine--N-acetylmuramyl-(pentapeptide) pyrophosphoryl-undecaprenol N-acetylglucosamine transferase